MMILNSPLVSSICFDVIVSVVAYLARFLQERSGYLVGNECCSS